MTIKEASDTIKRTVTMDDILPLYGYTVNRAGFMRCPFHTGDHTASLKVYNGARGWSCFGCHAGGTVIDFVMQSDSVSFAEAVKDIDQSLSLHLLEAKQQRSLETFVKNINRKQRMQYIRAMMADCYNEIYQVKLLDILIMEEDLRQINRKPRREWTARDDARALAIRDALIGAYMEIKIPEERRSKYYDAATI